jgi:hypothetical protein
VHKNWCRTLSRNCRNREGQLCIFWTAWCLTARSSTLHSIPQHYIALFLSCVVRLHSGEMAPELIKFIEWVTGYRRRAAKVGGLSMMGPLRLGSRKSSALAFRRGSRRSSQGLLDGLWHPRGSLGHSLDKAAHDAVRWALN